MGYRCQGVLNEFLEEIKRDKTGVKYEGMANILILHCHSDGKGSLCFPSGY